jgi:hypothetical protein
MAILRGRGDGFIISFGPGIYDIIFNFNKKFYHLNI